MSSGESSSSSSSGSSISSSSSIGEISGDGGKDQGKATSGKGNSGGNAGNPAPHPRTTVSVLTSSSSSLSSSAGDEKPRKKRTELAIAVAPKKRKDISDASPAAAPEKKKKRQGKLKSLSDDDSDQKDGAVASADVVVGVGSDDSKLGAVAAANESGRPTKTKKRGLLAKLSRKLTLRGKAGKKEKKPSSAKQVSGGTGYHDVHGNEIHAAPMTLPQHGGPLFASCFRELPEDLQKKVIRAKVDYENVDGQNWEVLLSVMRFVTKLNLASDYEHYKLRKKQREARDIAASNLPPEMFQSAEEHGVILRTNPKKIYHKAEFAGKGGFGRVFTCRSTIDKEKIVAVKKTPNRTPKEKRMNRDEIAVLHHCSHPNIVAFKRSYAWDQEMAIVMEYMEGGSLSEACKKFPFVEGHIALVAREVLNAISYLHSQNLVHRDLKSANIMMSTKGDIKLIDFGLTVHIDYCQTHMVGSPFWMPPEMIRNEPHGFPADIWSFAICLIEMADSRPPNRKSRILSLYESGTVGLKPYVDAQAGKYSDEFRDFLCRCLVMNPNDRATPSELLQHEFLSKALPKRSMEKALREVFFSKALDRSGFGGVIA